MKLRSGLSVVSVLLISSHGLFAQAAISVPSSQPVPVSAPIPTSAFPGSLPPATPSVLTKITPGDVLEITVYGVPDLGQKFRVSNSGDIYLPLLNHVHVNGLTAEQTQEQLAQKYKEGNFLVDPHVSVSIAESVSGVSIRGQVVKPGIYPVLGSAGLLDIITTAGGFTTDASNVLTVIHGDHPDDPETITLYEDPTKNQISNIPVYQGDTILVRRAGIVYVIGQVTAPTGLALTGETTIAASKAFAMAHGAMTNAALDRTVIIRKTTSGEQQNIPIHLGKILKSKEPDVALQANDILYVPNSPGKAAAKAGASAALALVTGLSIIAVERN